MNNIFNILDSDCIDLDIYIMPVSRIVLEVDTLDADYNALLSLDISNTFYYYINQASDFILLTAYILSKLIENHEYKNYYYLNRE